MDRSPLPALLDGATSASSPASAASRPRLPLEVAIGCGKYGPQPATLEEAAASTGPQRFPRPVSCGGCVHDAGAPGLSMRGMMELHAEGVAADLVGEVLGSEGGGTAGGGLLLWRMLRDLRRRGVTRFEYEGVELMGVWLDQGGVDGRAAVAFIREFFREVIGCGNDGEEALTRFKLRGWKGWDEFLWLTI
ncbi:hypothetical protein HK101_008991 [Irineochytrium annulatum]|nr:hypothetical protein HK101_008991 [Irineochytrium annulatum]